MNDARLKLVTALLISALIISGIEAELSRDRDSLHFSLRPAAVLAQGGDDNERPEGLSTEEWILQLKEHRAANPVARWPLSVSELEFSAERSRYAHSGAPDVLNVSVPTEILVAAANFSDDSVEAHRVEQLAEAIYDQVRPSLDALEISQDDVASPDYLPHFVVIFSAERESGGEVPLFGVMYAPTYEERCESPCDEFSTETDFVHTGFKAVATPIQPAETLPDFVIDLARLLENRFRGHIEQRNAPRAQEGGGQKVATAAVLDALMDSETAGLPVEESWVLQVTMSSEGRGREI